MQVAVIREAYECLSWDNHGIAEGRQAAEVWRKLNPLFEAVGERHRALKALLGNAMAVKRLESRRSLMKVFGTERTVTKGRRRRFEMPNNINRYKWQVRMHGGLTHHYSLFACV